VKGLGAVATLEFERRWTLLALGIAFGLLPFVIVPLFGVHESETQGIALVLALLLGSATALLLGTTAIAGDLAGGRLGFYFNRPLSWWQIWGGKLLATVGLTLASILLVVLPSLLVPRGGPAPFSALWDGAGALYLTGLILLALGVVQWGAVAVRSRSLWLMLDLAAVPLVAWGFADAMVRIFRQGLHPDPWGYSLLAWPVAIAFQAAGAAQMARGRTAPGRSHAVSSLTAWGLLAVIAGGWQVASRTVLTPAPARLARAWVPEPSARGDVGLIVGEPSAPGFGSHAWHSYLAAPSGTRLLDPIEGVYYIALSGDGSQLVAFCRSEESGPALVVRPGEGGDSTAREHRFPLSPSLAPGRMLVDEHGRRVALLRRDVTTLFDLSTGAVEATLSAADGGPVAHVQLNDAVPDRLFRKTEGGGLLIEDLSGSSVTSVAEIGAPSQGEWRRFHLDDTGERLLALGQGEAGLFATASGERLAGFAADRTARLDGLLLSDGRILIAAANGPSTRLRLLDATGEPHGELDLGPAQKAPLVETTPGRVVAAVGDIPYYSSHLAVIDLDPLRLVRIDENLDRPPGSNLIWAGGWHRDRPAGGTLLVTRLDSVAGHRIQSSVFRYDVGTGRTEWVAGRR